MYDSIIIKNLKIYAHHGVLPEEKREGQVFYLDIILYADLSKACHSDNVADTINYDDVCNCAYKIMTENTCDLIERAAQKVCDAILSEFPMTEQIELTLKKPSAPVKCDIEYAAVKICRRRESLA